MADYICILIWYICKEKSLHKVAIKIPNQVTDVTKGVCTENYKYYGEPEILDWYKRILPLHVSNHIDTIIDVEELFDICEVSEIRKSTEG